MATTVLHRAMLVTVQATTTIPIVMGVSGDPVGLGFVKSLARPGGNTTGVASLQRELGPKRFAARRERHRAIDHAG
jgi:ABC-type uncharacterized transport system substrate-binding protein